ncbi:hypothetical protein [Treponema phagedenis]|uniref:hypothetical protein n=1 Tax=Treponema phagedenis TaxID=162 RepID=UPI0020907EB9|nr:hypothetical protein [Treponema phagedenis]
MSFEFSPHPDLIGDEELEPGSLYREIKTCNKMFFLPACKCATGKDFFYKRG